jgi:hypothetical protein
MILLLLVLGLVFASGCKATVDTRVSEGARGKIKKIAVLDFKSTIPEREERSHHLATAFGFATKHFPRGRDLIQAAITTELQNWGKYQIMERQRLNKLLEEQKLSMTGLTEKGVETIGKLLNVDGVLFGTVTKFTKDYTLYVYNKFIVNVHIRLVEAATGKQVWTAKSRFEGPYTDESEAADKISVDIVNKLRTQFPEGESGG